jgi:hypothetical protein
MCFPGMGSGPAKDCIRVVPGRQFALDEAIRPPFPHFRSEEQPSLPRRGGGSPGLLTNEPNSPETAMRITTFALIGVLTLGGTAAFADTQQQLNHDIREDKGNLTKNESDAAHDRRDINRDRGIVESDRNRETADLSKADRKGAAYWNKEARNEKANIHADKKDLAHSARDIHSDKVRLAKAEKAEKARRK